MPLELRYVETHKGFKAVGCKAGHEAIVKSLVNDKREIFLIIKVIADHVTGEHLNRKALPI